MRKPGREKKQGLESPEAIRPFKDLATLVNRAGMHLAKEEPPPQPRPQPQEIEEAEGEEELFSRAMEGITRSHWRHKPLVKAEPVKPPPTDPENEDLQLMQAAVGGDPALQVLDHPEYIEGWTGVEGKRYLPNLRSDTYSLQGQLDLHGLSREEARAAVEEFVTRMSGLRSCCVKIIHGRGINSPNDQAVLKECLQRWLCTRRMSRYVLAYASAPFIDGGVGAVYVLLRGTRRP
jgi:DNA-nicking Smr family endonuclease